jgi:hypothetical protein
MCVKLLSYEGNEWKREGEEGDGEEEEETNNNWRRLKMLALDMTIRSLLVGGWVGCCWRVG